MKTLAEIKEEYAQEDNFNSWQFLFESCARYDYGRLENAINEVAIRYATEYAKETLGFAGENSRVMAKTLILDTGLKFCLGLIAITLNSQ